MASREYARVARVGCVRRVHLAERGGGDGLSLEGVEALLDGLAQLGSDDGLGTLAWAWAVLRAWWVVRSAW